MNKAGELLDLVRAELDDVAQPYLWTDDELLEYLDEAQLEAAVRGRLIVDATTSAVCQIPVTANNPSYALDPRVVRVNRAKLSAQDAALGMVMLRDLDRDILGWESWIETPRVAIVDWQTGYLRLFPTPDTADTLELVVVREPTAGITNRDDVLELRERYTRQLRHWMKHRAYLKRDSETYEPKKSLESLANFERFFGPVRPAYDEEWMQQYYAGDAYLGRY